MVVIGAVSYGLVSNVDQVPEDFMADRTDRLFLTNVDVAELGGVDPKSVSRARQRSKPGQRYADDPFPEPDGRHGQWPWWKLDREQEIRDWFARHQDRTGVGGRPRKSAGQG